MSNKHEFAQSVLQPMLDIAARAGVGTAMFVAGMLILAYLWGLSDGENQ